VKTALTALGLCFAINCAAPLAAALSPQERYLDIYLCLKKPPYDKGDHLGETAWAKVCLFLLEKLHQDVPNWEPELFQKRLADCKEEIAKLELLATKQVLDAFDIDKTAGAPTEAEIQKAILREQAAPLTSHALFPLMKTFEVLQIIHRAHPEWEKESIETRLKACHAEFDRLQALKE
jgi:hypothetical protein